jgi:hypothetical protein
MSDPCCSSFLPALNLRALCAGTPYTGIGSRETPPDILLIMCEIGAVLAARGLILRSGGASGADTAFEGGADAAYCGQPVPKEIFLPWRGFQRNLSSFHDVTPEVLTIAKDLHPVWDRLSQGAKRLHGRNVYQVLGHDLKAPSAFVVCWTRRGELNESMCTPATGGTATAIKLASRRGIPVFNLARAPHLELFQDFLRLPSAATPRP